MKTNIATLIGFALLCGMPAFPQDRFELFGAYSYLHFSPTLFGRNSISFNGGGGGAQLNFLKLFGLKGEFMGYGSTTFTKTLATPVTLPNGALILAGTYNAQGNMFTYLFGPVIRIPIPKVTPFGELLFGGSNTNGYVNLSKSIIAGGGTTNSTGVPATRVQQTPDAKPR